jgi:hypothetical protein
MMKLSAKKSPGFERHEDAIRTYRHIDKNCDPVIAQAIETVQQLVIAHHRTNTKSLSMRTIAPLLREHIDDLVVQWLDRFGEVPFIFSEVLVKEGTRGTLRFDNMRIFLDAEQALGNQFLRVPPTVAETASALTTLGLFCCTHRGDSVDMVTITSSKGKDGQPTTNIAYSRSKAKRLTDAGRKRRLHIAIEFTEGPQDRYCRLCRNLSEQAEEIIRVTAATAIDQILDERARELLRSNQNVLFHTPGLSDTYCKEHSPEYDHSGYKKAYARRELYGAMRRLLIDGRLDAGLSAPDYHIARTASFLIVDQCPNRKLVRATPQLIYDCHDAEVSQQGRLAKHLTKIRDAFRDANHELADLVDALAGKRRAAVYDAAKECGALSEREESLIASGFIYDPIRIMFKLGAQVFAREDA